MGKLTQWLFQLDDDTEQEASHFFDADIENPQPKEKTVLDLPAPPEIRDAANTILEWLDDQEEAKKLEAFESNPKVVTTGEWEGLKFEISMLQSQVADLLDPRGGELTQSAEDLAAADDEPILDEPTLEGILEELKRRNEAQQEDWGMDTPWTERDVQTVSLQAAPEGLLFGPYVLLTPEERDRVIADMQTIQTTLERTLTDYETDIRQWKSLVDGRNERIEMLEGALRNRDNTIATLTEDAPTITTKPSVTATAPPLPMNFMGSRPKPRGGIGHGPGDTAQRSVDEEWGRLATEGPD